MAKKIRTSEEINNDIKLLKQELSKTKRQEEIARKNAEHEQHMRLLHELELWAKHTVFRVDNERQISVYAQFLQGGNKTSNAPNQQ